MSRNVLSQEQVDAAWESIFQLSLDELPDNEISWERDLWRSSGADHVAALCEEILTERKETDFSIPGGAAPADLNRLIARVDRDAVMGLIRTEGLCVVNAVRLVYWAGLRTMPQ